MLLSLWVWNALEGIGRAEPPDFVKDIRPILATHCYACHADRKKTSGLRLDIKAAAMRGGENYGASMVPHHPDQSPLIALVSSRDPAERMPPEGPGLSQKDIALLTEWVAAGAEWPDGVDLAVAPDPSAHWSFQPLRRFEGTHTIDSWVDAALQKRGLSRSAPAEPLAWLRRVTLDLHGLPPSDEHRRRILSDPSTTTMSGIVDELLASPRYGERWAQHWLDVVRYADTHGFEVNTERPYAWHYRDYIIDALNADTPYDRFIREQIAGDALDRDTATGFLITASVLLPGQIGADEPSKRLARQDAIDEMVVNLGQTFLGLSIGCARCHDHKFDPITQRDYYAMQAFVAGVEYGDRKVRTEHTQSLEREIAACAERIANIDERLSRLEPIANPSPPTQRTPNSARNEENFASRQVRWVRFEIFDTNVHPSLGRLEPCLDELEVWTDEAAPRNVALPMHGASVTASGSRESASHRLVHLNDGLYGNEHSWMSSEVGRGWVQIELREPVAVNQIVWGRDRNEQYSDRTPSAYRIAVGESLDSLEEVIAVGTQRMSVQSDRNQERIAPRRAKKLRMTILATNSLEPCIDELEVWTTDGRNVALAALGTRVASEGDNIAPDRHELRFIHDGVVGNSRSWMSSAMGRGCVTLEFPESYEIERIVWGRDRLKEFRDRLANEYRFEIADVDDQWVEVANHQDRQAYREGESLPAKRIATHWALPANDRRLAEDLERERETFERQKTAAEQSQMAFAGVFRKPDTIRVLYRGDPEQPREDVLPHVPEFLGSMQLSAESDEQSRRIALANWIVSPEHPLTGRVMVNRIWQGHFGAGLVATPNDFGINGLPPSHPE
ncbi:MAG: DUF1549 domain-containing protein, partial [Pirellula sp.]